MAVDWDTLVIGPTVGIFGELFTFQFAGLGPFDATGVFDEEYREVDPGTGVPMMSSGPCLGIRLSDFPRPPRQNDRCTRLKTGEQFIVRKPKPDSHGHMLLILNGVTGGMARGS